MRFQMHPLYQCLLFMFLLVIIVRCNSSKPATKASNITNCKRCGNGSYGSIKHFCEASKTPLNRSKPADWTNNCNKCCDVLDNCTELMSCLSTPDTSDPGKPVNFSSNVATTVSTTFSKSENQGENKDFFDNVKNICIVAIVPPVVIIILIVLVVCRKRKRYYARKSVCVVTAVEIRQSVSTVPSDTVIESPIYCEADVFRFAEPKDHQNSEQNNVTEAVSDESIVVDSHTEEDEYCDPENIDTYYEYMRSREVNEGYSIAYDHLLSGYVNTFPRERSAERDSEYDYPRNHRSSTGSGYEYRYAYDWMNEHFEKKIATLSSSEPVVLYVSPDAEGSENDTYVNYPDLTQESAYEEKTEKPLEYVKVL